MTISKIAISVWIEVKKQFARNFLGYVSSANLQPAKVLPSFLSSNTLHEKFVNKKWAENTNNFVIRQNLIQAN